MRRVLIVLTVGCCALSWGQTAQQQTPARRKPSRPVPIQRPAATAPATGPIVLRGGKLLTITHGVIENGVLVMENGKITAVGKAGEVSLPKNARMIDVTGMTVYPGLIDSETHLGLTEVSADKMTSAVPHIAITSTTGGNAAFSRTVRIPTNKLDWLRSAKRCAS